MALLNCGLEFATETFFCKKAIISKICPTSGRKVGWSQLGRRWRLGGFTERAMTATTERRMAGTAALGSLTAILSAGDGITIVTVLPGMIMLRIEDA